MSESKVEIKIGEITFSGQGEGEWVAQQLDKVLERAEKLLQFSQDAHKHATETEQDGDTNHRPMGSDLSIAKKTLPLYLQEKGATANQVKKFLATSVWLEAKGQARLTTADIPKALKAANQTRIANPSDCLAKNIGKGYCEKDGKQFFVTDEGKKSL